MLSAYRYRLYPSGVQEMRLKRSLHALCDLYNTLRAEKVEQYQRHRNSLSRTGLRELALQTRRNNPKLQATHSQVSQNVADRLDSAFKNYFQRRARFPRSKRFKDYRSLTYPQSGFKLTDGRLHLSKIGKVRIFQHRPLEGEVRRLTVKYAVGEWYAILITKRTPPPKPEVSHVADGKVRGGDFGLEQFLTLDNAESAEYPKFLRAAEEKIKHLQRQPAAKREGSKRRRALALRLARLYMHVARQREDWQKKLVNAIFKETDVLVLEKLNVAGMLRNHPLAKAVSDSAWSSFAARCVRKADLLGKHVFFVDPWGTSQFCHQCLTWVPKPLTERDHKCPSCEADLSRDENSARLIKRLGTASTCPTSDGGSSLAEQKPLPTLPLRGRQADALKREAHNP